MFDPAQSSLSRADIQLMLDSLFLFSTGEAWTQAPRIISNPLSPAVFPQVEARLQQLEMENRRLQAKVDGAATLSSDLATAQEQLAALKQKQQAQIVEAADSAVDRVRLLARFSLVGGAGLVGGYTIRGIVENSCSF